MEFSSVKVGDTVTRLLGGTMPMDLKVTEVTDDLIICGPYQFSKRTGGEIDEDLDWTETHTGSFLKNIE
ncbi:MAG: hypothetical protein H7831_11620 [Magnetococcus sp. WYHC-3]